MPNIYIQDTRVSDYQQAIGATQLRNITGNVERLVNETRNQDIFDVFDCCRYRYQILDTYCASQNFVGCT